MNKTPINSTITPNYLNEYINYQESQNKSMNTINAYVKDIRMFFRHFNLSPSVVGREQIKEYKEHLQNVKNNNAKTINRSLSSLKSYNEFLIKEGWQENLVVLGQDHVKVQKQLTSPTNVNLKEANRFMEKVKKNECMRNYHIVRLLLNTGLRITELLSIELDDINFKRASLRVVGKGSKQRIIPLNKVAIEIINKAIEDRENYNHAIELGSQYLFLSNKSKTGRLESSSVERIFNKHSNVITPHKLRHIFATNYLKNGGSLKELQEILGHGSLSTTQIYLHPSQDDMRNSMNNCCI